MQFNIADSFDAEDEVSLRGCRSDAAPRAIVLKGAAVELKTTVSPLCLWCQLTTRSELVNVNLRHRVDKPARCKNAIIHGIKLS